MVIIMNLITPMVMPIKEVLMRRKDRYKLDRCLIELENLVKDFEDQITYKKAFDSYFRDSMSAFNKLFKGDYGRGRNS